MSRIKLFIYNILMVFFLPRETSLVFDRLGVFFCAATEKDSILGRYSVFTCRGSFVKGWPYAQCAAYLSQKPSDVLELR